MIFVGIDEAGYGPTFGPLVVSASAFRFPSEGSSGAEPAAGSLDLWETLAGAVTRKPDGARVPVDDSKKLYKPGKGLATLEEGVLPFVHLREDGVPRDLRALLRALMRSDRAESYLDHYPWYRARNVDIPTATFPNYVRVLADRLRGEFEARRVELLGVVSIPIEVIDFNRSLERHRNKSLVPFTALGILLARLWRTFRGEHLEVVIDRQGGRIQYAPLLYRAVKPRGIQIESQSPESSVYTLRSRDGAGVLRVTFTKQGDSKAFAVALASMASKYVRELHMKLFNQYWSELQDGLRPTAGYPTDARRFLAETADLRSRLGTDETLLIRER